MGKTWPGTLAGDKGWGVHPRRSLALALLVAVVPSVLACGGGGPPPAASPAPTVEPPPPAPPVDALPKGHIWRYQLMEVMSPGMGAFLQRVDVKEKMVDGQFRGFQILALQGERAFWQGVDLQVGDVVTSVNASPIGHYDEAFRVWQSLLSAPEIVVAYERGGEPRELRIVVHEDDEAPEGSPKNTAGKAPPAPAAPTASASAPASAPALGPSAPKK